MKPKSKSGFFIHIVLPSALAVLLFVATLFVVVIPSFENAMMDRKREMIRELTNAATSILAKYHKDETDSILTRSEAQMTAISRMEYLRYGEGNKDYFWITDTVPLMIMHPYRPELNGQNLSDFKDSHGKRLFVESVKISQEEGHGFVDYMWQWKDDSTLIVPKLSYVNAFKPWGWIIGTGIYIEDVKKEISSLSQKFVQISLIIALITALILFYVGRQSLGIERRRLKAEEDLNASREKYKSLVEASTEGLVMITDKKITYANHVLQLMTSLTLEEIVSKEIKEILLLNEDILTHIYGPHTNITLPPFETFLVKANGQTTDVLVNVSRIIFNEKQAYILSVKDVSSDKQIKEELFRSKDKFMTLMDKLNIGLFRTTVDLKGKFLEANDTTLQILEYKSFEELSSNYILDLFVETDDKKTFRKNLIEKGFVRHQIVKLKRKNGQIVTVAVSLLVVNDTTGTPLFCDGILEDISLQQKQVATKDDIYNEYVTFTQLYYQEVSHLMHPLVLCFYQDNVQRVAEKMTQAGEGVSFVVSEQQEIMGIVTDADIRARFIATPDSVTDKVFSLMTAPVVSLSSHAFLFEALHLFTSCGINYILVKDKKGIPLGYITLNDVTLLQQFILASFKEVVKKSKSVDELLSVKETYVEALLPLIESAISPHVLFYCLSVLSDVLTNQIIELCIKELGTPPTEFCFIILGSEARREQSLSTDQDNALIYKDVSEAEQENVKAYFDKLSIKICTMLNHVGYTFCKGNVMAMNPDWCQPLKVWKSYFTKWINKGTAQDLLDINIFFDIRPVYGQFEMAEEVKAHIFKETKHNPAYLYQLTQITLSMKPQVGFWGNIQLETAGAPPETVNIKDAIMPIVNCARIYSLKHSNDDAGTTDRFTYLKNNGEFNQAAFENVVMGFEYLNKIRLKHQAALIRQGLKPNNLISTNNLSELDKTIIKKVLSQISNMLSKLSYDFKGTL